MAKSLVTIPPKSKVKKSEQIDDVAHDVVAALNKKMKDIPNAFTTLTDANLVKRWVSSGFDILDLAISNKPNGGYGFGTVVEIYGLPGTGKSLLAAHALTETQKQGGLAVLYDTENAIGMLDFYRSVGLNTDTCIYSDKTRALEDVFESMESLIENIIRNNFDRPVTIVVDSIMGATTNAEISSDYEISGFSTAKAKVLSIAMRKLPSLIVGRDILVIFINQLKDNIGAVGFGVDPYKTTGGTSIAYTASVRLRLKRIGALKISGEEVGTQVKVQVAKNRLGPPNRQVILDLYYDRGGDNYGSWLKFMKDQNLIKSAGAYYSYMDGDTELKFQSKDFRKMLVSDKDLRDRMYARLCDTYIMRYSADEYGIDDVEVGSEDSNDE